MYHLFILNVSCFLFPCFVVFSFCLSVFQPENGLTVVRRSASYLLVGKRRVGSDPSHFPRSTQGEGARPCSFPSRSSQKIEPVGRAVNSREVDTLPATKTTLPVRSGNLRRCSGNPSSVRIERVHIRSVGTVRSLDTAGENPWRKTGLAWNHGLAARDSAQNKKGPNNEQTLD
jgi:hypothetical protein